MSDPKERRKHARTAARGEVTLRFDGLPEEIKAVCVDESETGFRARHRNLASTGNQQVHFQTNTRSGTARVVWNRILGQEVESGFLIMEFD